MAELGKIESFKVSLDSKQGEQDGEFIMVMRAVVIVAELLTFGPGLYFLLKTMFK